jgi:hypothetical protein
MRTKYDAQALVTSKIIPKVIFKYFRAKFKLIIYFFFRKQKLNTMLLTLFWGCHNL